MICHYNYGETGNGKRETGNGKRETGNGKRETGNGKRETGNGDGPHNIIEYASGPSLILYSPKPCDRFSGA
jgi:hypothetical protein